VKALDVDAKNMPCPMPLLKLKQALNTIEKGDSVHLIATDPTSKRDIASYVALTSHQLSSDFIENEYHYFVIKG